MMLSDPTARAALRNDDDVLGLALAQLNANDAAFLILHHCFKVPVAALTKTWVANGVPLIPDYDYLGHVHGMLDHARFSVASYLEEQGITWEDLDWQSSAAVRAIGDRYGVDRLLPCADCGQDKIPIIAPGGRPREYCSNACRQSAYRKRLSTPHSDLNAPERGMLPCFAGMERQIPFRMRMALVALVSSGTVGAERLLLPPVDSSQPHEGGFEKRWSRASPMTWAARAAAAYWFRRGVWDFSVHQSHPSEFKPHHISLTCRYLDQSPGFFERYGGIEWLEIPRPRAAGPVTALRITTRN
ncbi:hypothetical protein [Actinosynnema pretiosum]|uniref:Uncharacterized protein n=1 Tax=Actinosynnema pretiosum TaxID=42197 RepID=A0A290Z0Z8_9PSEU|nr:hypothetical protein [Actinosynnema pretiosum]ATE52665.1 hypothetical protein CNX65_04690 [Actinosynnema pretiosum]